MKWALAPSLKPDTTFIGEDRVELIWPTQMDDIGYAIRYKAEGQDVYSEVFTEESGVTLIGLEDCQEYAISMRRVCGNGENSGWSEPLLIFTNCIATTVNENPSGPSWKVFPNPSSGRMFIEGPGMEILNYEVRNVWGSVLREGKTEGELLIDGLGAGVYFLVMRAADRGEHQQVFRIVLAE